MGTFSNYPRQQQPGASSRPPSFKGQQSISQNLQQLQSSIGTSLAATSNSLQGNVYAKDSTGSSAGGSAPKEIPCPFCDGEVLAKQAGRPFTSISSWLQRSFKIRIPTELIALLKAITPVSKASIRKNPETCKACDGKRTILMLARKCFPRFFLSAIYAVFILMHDIFF